MENIFSTAKAALVIKPKTTPLAAFNYKTAADLKNLIAFVGSKPKVDVSEPGDLVLSYKRFTLKDNSIVLRDAFGNVTKVMTYEEAAELYEIAAQKDFEVKDANKVIKSVSKPVKK